MTYNGWENYPTWNVALWLDNDEGLYNAVRSRVRDEMDDDERGWTYKVPEAIRLFVEDIAEATCPGVRSQASFVTDIFGWALDQVDWQELAVNYIAELKTEEVTS